MTAADIDAYLAGIEEPKRSTLEEVGRRSTPGAEPNALGASTRLETPKTLGSTGGAGQ